MINLPGDYLCIHTPIPTTFEPTLGTAGVNSVGTVEFVVDGQSLLNESPKIYNNNGVFYFDMALWAKLAFSRANHGALTYNVGIGMIPNPELQDITINTTITTGSTSESDSITATFVNCSLQGGILEPDTSPIRVWKDYPISWIDSTGETLNAGIAATKPTIAGREVEFIENDCQGTYLKWFNEYGTWSYWLFPGSRIFEREGSELYRVNRNIFNPDKTSNEDTVGFDVTEVLSVGDPVLLKRYWPTIRSLVGSPDVYMLKPEKNGTSPILPSDWIKIIQSDVTFERDQIGRSATEFEAEFDLPKVYSVKYI